MSDEEPLAECDDCGRSVPLFAAVCPGCRTGLTGPCEAPCTACGTGVDHRRHGDCPDCGTVLDPWDVVVDRVRKQGFHVAVPVSERLPCPTTGGFARGRGKPVGQRADYRRPLDDGSEIHVREYADRYEVHHDRRSARNRVRHLTWDAPVETALGVASCYLLARATRRVAPLERLSALVSSGLADRVSVPSLTGLPKLGAGGLQPSDRFR